MVGFFDNPPYSPIFIWNCLTGTSAINLWNKGCKYIMEVAGCSKIQNIDFALAMSSRTIARAASKFPMRTDSESDRPRGDATDRRVDPRLINTQVEHTGADV